MDDVSGTNGARILGSSSPLGSDGAALPAAVLCRTHFHAWLAVGASGGAGRSRKMDRCGVSGGVRHFSSGNGVGRGRGGGPRRRAAAQAIAGGGLVLPPFCLLVWQPLFPPPPLWGGENS